MKLNQKLPSTILFTHYGEEWIRGSERCLLDLLTHINRNKYRPVVWCNSPIMAHEVRRLKVPVIQFDLPLSVKQHQNFSINAIYHLFKQGLQLVDKHRVKLIHANSGLPNRWLNLVARARHTPLLVHLHSHYPLHERITHGLHHVAMTVGPGQSVINQLLQDGISNKQCRIITNGIDSFKQDKKLHADLYSLFALDSHDFLIATTASLIKRKGIDLIINSIHRLIDQGIPAQFIIIGNGPEYYNLLQQAQQLGIQDRVHLLGEQSNVAGLLRGGVDLFVSAARDEAFGLALAEASLCQLAVIAPAVGGIPNVIKNRLTGLLFPAQDITAMTQSICRLYYNPELGIAMGKAGRRHVLSHFSIQRYVQQFEQLYSCMLQNSSMHMHWFSHWNFTKPIMNIAKRLPYLVSKQLNKEVTL